MLRRLHIWILRPAVWLLAAVGLVALVAGAMVAAPVSRPPVNPDILSAAQSLDRAGLPPLTRFQARDGTELAYRLYPASGGQPGIVAIVVHGSAGHSAAMNPLAKALAAGGLAVAAPDIRGHGASGNRGDIGYIGQLEDDLEDLLAEVRGRYPDSEFVLIGHSSGGGFALRAATAPVGAAFERVILLAPFLGPFAPTTLQPEGEDAWAEPDIPRIVALGMLDRLGIRCCGSLPVIAFALPEDRAKFATLVYSYRLLTNFGPPEDYEGAFAAAASPVVVIAGENDTLMDSARYPDVVGSNDTVEIMPDIGHMSVIDDPAALAAIVAAARGE